MGQGQSASGGNPGHGKLLFSPESQDKLQKVFLEASLGDPKICLVKGLQERLSQVLDRNIAHRLCVQMQPDGRDRIDYHSYVFLANQLLKATIDERSALIETLASGEGGSVDLLDLKSYVERMVMSYLQIMRVSVRPNMSSLDRLTSFLLGDLREKQPGQPLTQTDIEKWLLQSPLFGAIQTNVFRSAFDLDIPHAYAHLIPALCDAPPQHTPLLGALELMFVNHALPQATRSQWRLLFSNHHHGQSFSKMVGSILGQGPSVVVIRDTAGHIFGGFAPDHWQCHSNFYGSSKTFIFSIYPKMEHYLPSGFNDNYMYLNVNQQTLPNGLGFGGKFQYFGIFVSGDDFGQGFTAPTCTTFNSGLLSGSKRFIIDAIEIWALGPKPAKSTDEASKPKTDAQDKSGRPSILDADATGAAMIEMVRGGMHSEGIRETPTSDIPGEKAMPPGM